MAAVSVSENALEIVAGVASWRPSGDEATSQQALTMPLPGSCEDLELRIQLELAAAA